MRIDLASPNRGIATAIFAKKEYGFAADYTDEDGIIARGSPAPRGPSCRRPSTPRCGFRHGGHLKHDLQTLRSGKSFLMMRDAIYAKPVDTGRKDADGLPVMERGAKMKSAKGREYHVDAYLYEPLIEVTGYDAEGNEIIGGALLDELADYIVTIPEGQAPAYVVAGVG
jgi:hypothetical protein